MKKLGGCKRLGGEEQLFTWDERDRLIRETQDGAKVDYRCDEAGRIVGRTSGSDE